MPTIFFAATSVADFIPLSGNVLLSTSATVLDPGVSEGVRLDTGSMTTPSFAGPTGSFFFRVYLDSATFNPNNSGSELKILFFDDSFDLNNPVMQMVGNQGFNNSVSFQIFNGIDFTTVLNFPAGFSILSGGQIDVEYVRGDLTGAVRFFFNGILVAEEVNIDTDLAAWTQITRTVFDQLPPNNDATISAFIIADFNTLLLRFIQADLTAAGTTNTFTSGGFADVNELGIDTGDAAISQVPGQILSIVTEIDNSINTGFDVIASVITFRGTRVPGAVPSGISAYTRTNGLDFFSAAVSLAEAVPNVVQFIQATNPDTGLAWTVAELEAAEIGIRSEL